MHTHVALLCRYVAAANIHPAHHRFVCVCVERASVIAWSCPLRSSIYSRFSLAVTRPLFAADDLCLYAARLVSKRDAKAVALSAKSLIAE